MRRWNSFSIVVCTFLLGYFSPISAVADPRCTWVYCSFGGEFVCMPCGSGGGLMSCTNLAWRREFGFLWCTPCNIPCQSQTEGAPGGALACTETIDSVQTPAVPELPAYFVVDFGLAPESKELLNELARHRPELVFQVASLSVGARSLQTGDASCTAPVDNMRYWWAILDRMPSTELAQLALNQPDALISFSEQDLRSMTTTSEDGSVVMLETSAARLPGHDLEVNLRASRLSLPPDFDPSENTFQQHISAVIGALRLRLELVTPAFARGVDHQLPEVDNCVSVDLYRIVDVSAL